MHGVLDPALPNIPPDQVTQLGFVGTFCGGFSIRFVVVFLIIHLGGKPIASANSEVLDAGYSDAGFGGTASATALICIRLFLAQERVASHDAASIAIVVSLKLIMHPLVTALLAFYVSSMPPPWSRSAVILSSVPIGSGPFTRAKLYGREAAVSCGSILAMGCICCLERLAPGRIARPSPRKEGCNIMGVIR